MKSSEPLEVVTKITVLWKALPGFKNMLHLIAPANHQLLCNKVMRYVTIITAYGTIV